MLVLPAWYPTARRPLAGPFVRDHVRAAAAYGHRMVVLVDEGPDPGLRGLARLSEERDGELRVFRLRHRPGAAKLAYLPAALLLARRLAREGTPVDVLHAHIHWMGWPAVLAGSILRRPVVITENSSEWPRRTMRPGALRRARIAFRRAALVCPVNERLREAIESYGVRGRFRIVPNTVDTATFHPGLAEAREATRLVNVALHVEVKALDVLLKAFRQASASRPELRLELIGDGPLTPELRQLAEELQLGERVHFSGRANPAAIAETLRSSDVFVISSLSENMPLAVIEALCCGLPVVGTDVGGIPEAVGADGVLALAGDPGALAAAIGTAISGYETFDRAAIARRAATRWSFEAVGRAWDEIYCSLRPGCD